jgi:hypothetical protein
MTDKSITALKSLRSKKERSEHEWIKLEEFEAYGRLVLDYLDLHKYKKDIMQLLLATRSLHERSGSQFAFTYLKECRTIVVRNFAGMTFTPVKRIYIKLDYRKFPKIIPLNLRMILRKEGYTEDNRKLIVGIMTILSVHRVFKTNPKVDLHSIVDEFSGYAKTLDPLLIDKSVKALNANLNGRWSRGIVQSTKVSPNTKSTLWGAEIDIFAFVHSLKKYKALMSLLIFNIDFISIFFFHLNLLLGLPFYLYHYYYENAKVHFGKLSVVYSQAGKARVIAISNFWVQQCLKPLHDKIFEILSKLKTDGTFDQKGCYEQLLARTPAGQILHGFDLSAATDRLPIELQCDILTHLGYDSKSWKEILSGPYIYNKEEIRYAVGQPMGAYSSWAMLALTHHIIVQIAALKAYPVSRTMFENYCILGDDIVIADDLVAFEYLHIMNYLGVNISKYKSIESPLFCEFAKILKGHDIDITPIPAGLLLKSIRFPKFSLNILWDLFLKKLYTLKGLDSLLRSISRFKEDRVKLMTCLLLQWCTQKNEITDVSFGDRSNLFIRLSTVLMRAPFVLLILKSLAQSEIESEIKLVKKSVKSFLHLAFKQSTVKNKKLLYLEPFLAWFRIGYIAYFSELIKACCKIWDRKVRLDAFNNQSDNNLYRQYGFKDRTPYTKLFTYLYFSNMIGIPTLDSEKTTSEAKELITKFVKVYRSSPNKLSFSLERAILNIPRKEFLEENPFYWDKLYLEACRENARY